MCGGKLFPVKQPQTSGFKTFYLYSPVPSCFSGHRCGLREAAALFKADKASHCHYEKSFYYLGFEQPFKFPVKVTMLMDKH
jgi:hypothetical protein